MSHAKTPEPIEMSFGLRTQVGPRNHVLDGGPHPPWEGAILRGKRAAHTKAQGCFAMSCAKMGGPILTIYMSITCFHERMPLLEVSLSHSQKTSIMGR